MDDWTSGVILSIDNRLKNERQRDLRFFRVEEFKRNVERTGKYSGKCPVCPRQRISINEVVEVIDKAIAVPGKERLLYDRLIGRLADHMQKEHGFYTPNHFTYRFSFYGMLAGSGAGLLFMLALHEHNFAFLSAGFSIGLLIGYLYGNNQDNKIREKKKLM